MCCYNFFKYKNFKGSFMVFCRILSGYFGPCVVDNVPFWKIHKYEDDCVD